MRARDVVLRHVDYEAAANPAVSGRPLETCSMLLITVGQRCCTRGRPLHGAPKVTANVAKGFSDAPLRWSTMDRELYTLWQGLLSH